MADTHTISNVWMAYIKNQPYIYPRDNTSIIGDGDNNFALNTGWHIFPNMFWSHFVTPAQWYNMIHNYEAYHVESVGITVFNLVPMTQQLAIQGTNIFTAFNNSLYGMGFSDDIYETGWHNWYSYKQDNAAHNLLYKEGLVCNWNGSTDRRFELPIYSWRIPNARAISPNTYNFRHTIGKRNNQDNNEHGNYSGVYPAGSTTADDTNHLTNFLGRPSGVVWDPLNRPEAIMEIRPGKNSVNFGWNCHPCDEGKWFNTDLLACWYPYTPRGPYHSHRQRPASYEYASTCDPDRLSTRFETGESTNPPDAQRSPINDYTIPNHAHVPIVPNAWWWQEMKSSIVPAQMEQNSHLRYIDMWWAGTEYEHYKYPPHQMFIKMLPLFDSRGTHIECSANISVKTTLTLKCKKRRTAIFAPTYGPVNWFNLYSARSEDKNYMPALIRYRTGGARTTWQNIADVTSDPWAHPRESPYNRSKIVTGGTGQGSTRTTTTITMSRRATAPPLDVIMEEDRPKRTRSASPRMLYPDLPSGHQV
nr:MAG: capsid protein [Myna chaphamaparvovirus]